MFLDMPFIFKFSIMLLLYKYLGRRGLYRLLLAKEGMDSEESLTMFLCCSSRDKIIWLNLYNKLIKYCLYIYSLELAYSSNFKIPDGGRKWSLS
ncbi:hypothetical protein RCIX265 [Methanocella arvoryzae MRE50]|uniref:Uncharacterized protein n=1 Tax=Methanocella arvoryzae (strain DSM 22066 / NBRC 105507 / MRE50) TaxID=351160 RepID=Q0W7B0_METAR|nr:hypothetical protein orf16 [uncultured archaeon]CAJ35733.1 hypothetical protein RCIX265 [Methanocella arvoryzae MRE50]